MVLSAAGTLAQPRVRKARRANASPWRDLAVAFGYVRRSRLLVWMTLAAVLFSVLFFSLYLPWATAATERFPDAGDLAGFFGLFWAAMTGAAFLVSVLVTNRLFARFGIATMMLVLPLLYVGSFGILLVSAGFVTLVVLRFVDGVWLQGVASPAWETLTNVVPDARRDQVRTFLNGGPAQAGTVIAGIIALVGQDVLSPRQFAAIGLAAAAIAVVVVWRVRASYASALVEALREGRPEVFPDVAVAGVPFAFAPDAHALGTLLLAMDDDRPPVRRLAVQLLADVDDARATAALERALHDGDPPVRAQAVDALASGPGRLDAEAFLPLLDDPDPAVAASAAVAAAKGDGAAAARVLIGLAADADPAVRSIALRSLANAPPDAAAGLAVPALDDEDPGVRAAALTTLAEVAPGDALGPAIRAFGDPSPRVREAAVAAADTARRSLGGRGARGVGPTVHAGRGVADARAHGSQRTGRAHPGLRRRPHARGERRRRAGGRRPHRWRGRPTPEGHAARTGTHERALGVAGALVDLDRRRRGPVRGREPRCPGAGAGRERAGNARGHDRCIPGRTDPRAVGAERWTSPGPARTIGSNGRRRTMMRSSRRAREP